MVLYRIVSLALASLLLMTLASSGMMAGVPDKDTVPRTITYINGDWVISGAASNSSEEIMLTGNLIIQNGGSLTLDNVTLMMNCTSSGQYRIEVQDGGDLILGGSLITNGLAPDVGYLFQVNAAAVLDARNSTIEKCGLLGLAGAEASGMRVMSSAAVFENATITGCTNGLIIDSCDVAVKNSTVADNLFNGIYLTGDVAGATVSGSNISGNAKSGILAEADYVNMVIIGSTLHNNQGNGTMLVGSISVNATVLNSTISSNKGPAAVGAMGSPSSVLNLDVRNNTVTENTGTGLKFGILALKGNMLSEVPVHSIRLNFTGNTVSHSGNTGNGIMFVYASESIQANVSENQFLASKMEYGISIGCLNTDFNLGPATRDVRLDFCNNTLTTGSKGALRVTSNGTLEVNMTGNYLYGTGSIDCGGVFLGWFQDDMALRAARNAALRVTHNRISKVSGGGLWMDSLDSMSAWVENNTFDGSVNGGALRIGGIIKSSPQINATVCHNSIGMGYSPGIHVVNPNNAMIFSNTVSGRSFTSGDGIRVESSFLFAKVYNNTVDGCAAGGIRLIGSRGVALHNNTLNNNQYGIVLDSVSFMNTLIGNTITKPDNKYGFFVATNSLDNAFPPSNTVNGEHFRYFRGMNGAPGALLATGNINFQYPPLMSNLGQVVYADCSYIHISNVTAGNGTTGLALVNVDDSVISGNTAMNNAVSPGHGIGFQSGSDHNTVYGNMLFDNVYGIGLAAGTKNRLWANTVVNRLVNRGGIYITPVNPYFDNEIAVNNTVNGDPVHYIWSNSFGVRIANVSVSAPMITNLGQIAVIGSAGVTLDNVSASNGIRGLYLQGSVNVTAVSSQFLNNTDNILLSASNLSVVASRLFGGSNGIRMISSSGSFTDSKIENATATHLNLSSASSLRALNLTFDKARTVIADASDLSVSWHFGVAVNAAGRPLEDARIVMADASGTVVLNETTDANGSIPAGNFTDYLLNQSGTHPFSPYSLSISKDGYSTHVMTLSLDEDTFVSVTLSDITPPAFAVAPTVGPLPATTSLSYVWLNATLDDTLSGNSTIIAAEWALAGMSGDFSASTAYPMAAADGTFDQARESVTALLGISSWNTGDYTLGVRGLDSAGNWCAWSSALLSLSDDQGPSLAFRGDLPPTRIGNSEKMLWMNLTADDTGLGGTPISGIEWRVLNHTVGTNGTLSTSVFVLDGSLNSAVENVNIRIFMRYWAEGRYTAYARARDSAGNNGSWLVWDFEVFDDITPSAPIGVWASNTTVRGELKLTWAPNAEADLAGYNIYRTTVPGRDYEFITSVNPGNSSWYDTGLADGTQYYYVISAFDSAAVPNESPFSAEVGARTPSAPADVPETDSGSDILPVLAVMAIIMLVILLAIVLIRNRPRGGKPPEPEV